MIDHIRKKAKDLGFPQSYFLTPEALTHWQNAVSQPGQFPGAAQLCGTPTTLFPEATCLILLIYPYSPFPMGERIPAYYPASQAGYFRAKELALYLSEQGCPAQLSHAIPARALALTHNIGIFGLNGLLSLPGYGTRIALYVIAVSGISPESAPVHKVSVRDPQCAACGLCVKACPAHAIDPVSGLTPLKCMRAHMEQAPFPEWVEQIMPGYIGCEICQSVCPRNAHLPLAIPDPALIEAFDPEKLASGDQAAARKLVGKNMTRHDKLSYQAKIFLQNQIKK